MNRSIKQIMPYLPREIQGCVDLLPQHIQEHLEELRFRINTEPTIVVSGVEQPLALHAPILVTGGMLRFLVDAASNYSAYAVLESMQQGFITLEGGHRMGICGTAVMEQGCIKTLSDHSSINLRVARQWTGCGEKLFAQMETDGENLLLLGPPNCGKTTLLRDLIRLISDKGSQRVGLADGRGEIAACVAGIAQLNVGQRTDIITGASKEKSIELLLRVMNPNWIAVDEITALEDVESLMQASYCGVNLLATAHGNGVEDLMRRPIYRKMMDMKIFSKIVVLNPQKDFTIERV